MKKMILLMLLYLMIVTGCSTEGTIVGQDFGIKGFETGKHAFFLFTSAHWQICQGQLVQLEKRWDEISNGEVSIHVLVPGTEEEVAQMKKQLGLSYEVQAVTDFEFHNQFGLIEEQSDQSFLPLRGYGLVKDGKIVDAREDDSVGLNSVKIVEKLMD